MTSLQTSRNFIADEHIGEGPFGPSQTQPDETLTVREILDRFTRGLPMTTGDVGYYDDPDDLDMSDFDAMDPFEKEMHIREHREYLADLEKRMKETDTSVNSSDPKGQEPAEGGKPQMSDSQPTPQE